MRHRYDQETKDRAVRMFEQRREEQPDESRKQALQHLSGLIGLPPDTIRGWVDRARAYATWRRGRCCPETAMTHAAPQTNIDNRQLQADAGQRRISTRYARLTGTLQPCDRNAPLIPVPRRCSRRVRWQPARG